MGKEIPNKFIGQTPGTLLANGSKTDFMSIVETQMPKGQCTLKSLNRSVLQINSVPELQKKKKVSFNLLMHIMALPVMESTLSFENWIYWEPQ